MGLGFRFGYGFGLACEVRTMADGIRRNFIGEKIVRRVVMQPGVEVEPSKNQKDELQLWGNSLENVSQSAADIQQICRVRNKDIRKVRILACNVLEVFGATADLWNSSWMVCTFRRRAMLKRNKCRSVLSLIHDVLEHKGYLHDR